MSLFLEERMKEQIEDPANDKIIFTHPWIVTIDPREDPDDISFSKSFRTSYYLGTEKWEAKLDVAEITIRAEDESFNNDRSRLWNGSTCFISYNLFYDNDMRFLRYSSNRIKMEEREYSFRSPFDFLDNFADDVAERKVLKVVIYVELHLPLQMFYRPFDNPMHPLSKKLCDEYPQDLESNYKFVFLKTSDYSIKCRDGTVPASKMLLNVTSTFMMNHFKETNGNELIVDYSMDFVKPVIYFLHTFCFEMPASYNLEYARRLLEVINFFQPIQIIPFRKAVHQSLCRKFVEKTIYTFDSLLPWLSIACDQKFYALAKMITSLIAGKYFFKWSQMFPQNARNDDNPNIREVFGTREDFDNGLGAWVFRRIEAINSDTFQCNVILP